MTGVIRTVLASVLNAPRCRRACKHPAYSVSSAPYVGGMVKPNTSQLMAYYTNLNIVMKSEYLVYDFSAIVAAVGGSLGLFLGFSFHDGTKKLLDMIGDKLK